MVVSAEHPIFIAMRMIPMELVMMPQSYPSSSPAVCKQVWQPDGWVCNATQVVKFAATDASKIAQVKSEWSKLRDQLTELITLLSQQYPQFKKHDAFNNMKMTLTSMNVGFSNNDVNKCWDEMEKIRRVSLCYTCSAQNYNYFLKQKGLMPYSTCYDLIQICRPHFNHIRAYKDMRVELRNFFKDHIPNYPQYHSDNLDLYETRFFNLYYFAIFKPNDQKNNAKVCENCITLSGRPILDQLIKNFKKESEAMLSYLKKPSRALQSRSNWKSRKLSLNENMIEALLMRGVDVVFPGPELPGLAQTLSDFSNTPADLLGKKPQNFSMVPW